MDEFRILSDELKSSGKALGKSEEKLSDFEKKIKNILSDLPGECPGAKSHADNAFGNLRSNGKRLSQLNTATVKAAGLFEQATVSIGDRAAGAQLLIEEHGDNIAAAGYLPSGKVNQLIGSAAIYAEKTRVDQEALEARQKKADTYKWLLVGTCAVISVAAIAFSGGAAAPLVLAGVGALTGVLSGGGNAALNEYVEHGFDPKSWDWNNIGYSAAVGGITGAISGAAGGVSGTFAKIAAKTGAEVISGSLTEIKNQVVETGTVSNWNEVGNAALLSASKGSIKACTGTLISAGADAAWDKIGAGFTDSNSLIVQSVGGTIEGSVESTVKGTVNRFASTLVDTGDAKQAFNSAVDLEKIGSDAATGALSGASKGYWAGKEHQAWANEADLVKHGQGTRDWTAGQQVELMKQGKISGFEYRPIKGGDSQNTVDYRFEPKLGDRQYGYYSGPASKVSNVTDRVSRFDVESKNPSRIEVDKLGRDFGYGRNADYKASQTRHENDWLDKVTFQKPKKK